MEQLSSTFKLMLDLGIPKSFHEEIATKIQVFWNLGLQIEGIRYVQLPYRWGKFMSGKMNCRPRSKKTSKRNFDNEKNWANKGWIMTDSEKDFKRIHSSIKWKVGKYNANYTSFKQPDASSRRNHKFHSAILGDGAISILGFAI